MVQRMGQVDTLGPTENLFGSSRLLNGLRSVSLFEMGMHDERSRDLADWKYRKLSCFQNDPEINVSKAVLLTFSASV